MSAVFLDGYNRNTNTSINLHSYWLRLCRRLCVVQMDSEEMEGSKTKRRNKSLSYLDLLDGRKTTSRVVGQYCWHDIVVEGERRFPRGSAWNSKSRCSWYQFVRISGYATILTQKLRLSEILP